MLGENVYNAEVATPFSFTSPWRIRSESALFLSLTMLVHAASSPTTSVAAPLSSTAPELAPWIGQDIGLQAPLTQHPISVGTMFM